MVFHRHNWKIKAGQVVDHFNICATRPYKTITKILYQCEVCKKTKIKKLDGSWELKDLQ